MELLDKFWSKGKDFLGVKYPVICGAMTWISTYDLVKSVCDHGGFGVLAGGNMPPEMFEEELDKCIANIDSNFGVNLITIAPNFQDHLDIVEKKDVKVVVFAGTIPSKPEIIRMKESGKKVMAFAPSASVAKRMIKHGVDALIIEGFEAGGHVGHVSTTVLIQEVLFQFNEVPIFVAGGIATGEMIAHLLMMGAAGVQLGTRFVMTEECKIHDNMKKSFSRAQARHAISSTQVSPALPVVGVRALKNKAGEDFAKLQIELLKKLENKDIEKEEAIMHVENFWIGGLRKAAIDGDVDEGSLMAGQSVGLFKEIIPMKQVFDNIETEAEAELSKVKSMF